MDAMLVRLKAQIAECEMTCRTMHDDDLVALAKTDSLAALFARKVFRERHGEALELIVGTAEAR